MHNPIHQGTFGLLATLLLLNAMGAGAAAQSSGTAEKFIPTFAICYSNAKGARSTEETAKFDLLLVSFSKRAAQVWGKDGKNSWETLKALNPNMVIAPYAMGPGEYNTADWGQMGEGWPWMKAQHGKDSADRWVAVGSKSGGYLRAVPYPNERLMEYGNTNWHRYWCQSVYQDYWQGRKGVDCRGANGLFSDNTSFQVAWAGQWRIENQPDQADFPTSFYIDGAWRHDVWKEGFFKFLHTAVPMFASNQIKMVLNTGQIGRDPESWKQLDAMPNPPYAAMEEGGFVCPWGGDQKSFKSWDWEKKLAPFSQLRHVKVLMCNHAGPFSGDGLAAMDSPDANGMTGWDALWFSLTSFLLGYDDVSRNGLMNFTIWGYSEYHWFDEFDPRYLHLGKALGPFAKRGQVHFREFEDGWVAVNGDAKDASGVRVPSGSARVLNHQNFKSWERAPLVTSFNLPAHRGVVLLREGKQAGDADNLGRQNLSAIGPHTVEPATPAKKVFLYSRYFNAAGESRYLPEGTYRDVLQHLQTEFEVRANNEPLTDASLSGVKVVLIANPSDKAVEDHPAPHHFSATDIAVLTRYVQNGGGLILMGNQENHNLEVEDTNKLLTGFGLQFTNLYTDVKKVVVPRNVPVIGGLTWAYYTGNLLVLATNHPAQPRALVINDPSQKPLNGPRNQAGVLLAVAELGKGRIVAVTDAGWITNDVLADKGIGGVVITNHDNWEIFRRLSRWAAGVENPAGQRGK